MCGAVVRKLLADKGVKIIAHSVEIAGISAKTCDHDVIEKNDVRCADAPRYDLAPHPAEDGIVDVEDLIALSEHLFEDYRTVAHWRLDEAEGDVAYDRAAENDGIMLGNPV